MSAVVVLNRFINKVELSEFQFELVGVLFIILACTNLSGRLPKKLDAKPLR